MTNQLDTAPLIGTVASQDLTGVPQGKLMVRPLGGGQCLGYTGVDVLHDDFFGANVLEGTDAAKYFAQIGESDGWSVKNNPGGHTIMTQVIETAEGDPNTISFKLAADFYRVVKGRLCRFDARTENHPKAGSGGPLNVNFIGFNQEDDMLYAIAVGRGKVSQSDSVQHSDLIAFDAVDESQV